MHVAAKGRLVDLVVPLEEEGTRAVVRTWLKAVGEAVGENEAVVELETDKVAMEAPSPCAGVLVEQLLAPGEEAEPGAVLGRLRPQGADGHAPAPVAKAPSPRVSSHHPALRLSPSVRRLLSVSGLDPASLAGSGRGGRLTREDVAAAISARGSAPAQAVRRIPHDPMRRSIAEHMARSVATAPHVTAVFDADFSAILAHRQANARPGLTITAYLVVACARAMEAAPTVNSRWHEDHLEVFADVNVGVGVALGEKGLIVPVVHRAQSLSLFKIAERLADVTERARAGKLTAADVRGGTFSISNHGVSGSLLAAPIIINQPQSAILGVGKLEKRVVVRQAGGADAIQIRPMAYVSLTIDHRALDGVQTNAWLTRFVEALETWPSE